MGTKNVPGVYDCYANADPDEPMFVLLARDRVAADTVRMWAVLRIAVSRGVWPDVEDREEMDALVTEVRIAVMNGEAGDDAAQILEALRCADEMDAWRSERADGES